MARIGIFYYALMFHQVQAESIDEVRAHWRELVKQDKRYGDFDFLDEDANGEEVPILKLDYVDFN